MLLLLFLLLSNFCQMCPLSSRFEENWYILSNGKMFWSLGKLSFIDWNIFYSMEKYFWASENWISLIEIYSIQWKNIFESMIIEFSWLKYIYRHQPFQSRVDIEHWLKANTAWSARSIKHCTSVLAWCYVGEDLSAKLVTDLF